MQVAETGLSPEISKAIHCLRVWPMGSEVTQREVQVLEAAQVG